MKTWLLIPLLLLLPLLAAACTSDPEPELVPPVPEQPVQPEEEESENENQENMETSTIRLRVGGKTFTATLVDNSSTRALKALLAEGDLTIEMEDYARMEKVGPIRYFVIYYGRNSYSLTRLGKIDNVSESELKAALGDGDVTVTLALSGE